MEFRLKLTFNEPKVRKFFVNNLISNQSDKRFRYSWTKVFYRCIALYGILYWNLGGNKGTRLNWYVQNFLFPAVLRAILRGWGYRHLQKRMIINDLFVSVTNSLRTNYHVSMLKIANPYFKEVGG